MHEPLKSFSFVNLFCKTPSPSEAANSRNWNDNSEMNLRLKSKEKVMIRNCAACIAIKNRVKNSMGTEHRVKNKGEECCKSKQ